MLAVRIAIWIDQANYTTAPRLPACNDFPNSRVSTIIAAMNRLLRKYGPWPVLVTGGIAGVGGLAGIKYLTQQWPVSPENDLRFPFFVALWLAVSGTALPLIWLLHHRFRRAGPGAKRSSYWTLARQAAWVGIWGTACAWLQMHRLLNWAMALLLVAVLLLLEALLLTRLQIGHEP